MMRLSKKLFVKKEDNFIFNRGKFIEVLNARLLDDSYTKHKNKVDLMDENSNLISDSNEIILSYSYKDCVLEVVMELVDDN